MILAHVVAFLLNPLGRVLAAALVLVIVLGGIYYKIRSDGVQAERNRIERENRNAIDKARAARDAARDDYDRDPSRGVPDNQLRD